METPLKDRLEEAWRTLPLQNATNRTRWYDGKAGNFHKGRRYAANLNLTSMIGSKPKMINLEWEKKQREQR